MRDETTDFVGAQSRILALMRSTFEDRFKVYYDGLPNDAPPEAAYPMIIVHKIAGAVTLGATGKDEMRSQINIHFLLNETDDLNVSSVVNTTQRKLENLIEARDAATGQWKVGTAMYALATNFTLTETTIELDRDIQYDLTFRQDLPTIMEGVIQIITRELIPVPNRN